MVILTKWQALKRLGTRGGGPRRHLSHGPQAPSYELAQGENPHRVHDGLGTRSAIARL